MFEISNSEAKCETAVDCRVYRTRMCYNANCGMAYCFHGKCTCERGSVVHMNQEGQLECKQARCTKVTSSTTLPAYNTTGLLYNTHF